MRNLNFEQIGKQLKEYIEDPKVILANKLYGSSCYLGKIEMFIFALFDLTWEDVQKYDPFFEAKRTKEDYEKMLEYCNHESQDYLKIRKKLLQIIDLLDQALGIQQTRPSTHV